MTKPLFRILLFFSIFHCQNLFAANIGFLIVATGKYIAFVPDLINSGRHFFLTNHTITYFVFTDQPRPPELQDSDVIFVEQKRLGWPYDTMMRYHIYASHEDLFLDQDYLFASDADMRFVDIVTNEILGERIATLHPGFYNGHRKDYTYESNPQSTAYIPPNKGSYYFCGGFYGGSTPEFLKICHTNVHNIDEDLAKGLIAVWHDESHWNCYCVNNPPTIILSPSYCYTLPYCYNVAVPYPPKLCTVDKDLNSIRAN